MQSLLYQTFLEKVKDYWISKPLRLKFNLSSTIYYIYRTQETELVNNIIELRGLKNFYHFSIVCATEQASFFIELIKQTGYNQGQPLFSYPRYLFTNKDLGDLKEKLTEAYSFLGCDTFSNINGTEKDLDFYLSIDVDKK